MLRVMHTIRLASLATATVAPRAVLNFWFDDAWATPAMHRSNKEWKKMNPLWWGISPTYKPLSAAEHSAIDANVPTICCAGARVRHRYLAWSAAVGGTGWHLRIDAADRSVGKELLPWDA